MNNEKHEKDILAGVNCEVTECIYHNGIANCVAPFVNIKNKNSLFSTGTQCETFKEKQ